MVHRGRHVAEFARTVVGPGVLRNPSADLRWTRIRGGVIDVGWDRPRPCRSRRLEGGGPPSLPVAIELVGPGIDNAWFVGERFFQRARNLYLVSAGLGPVFGTIVSPIQRSLEQVGPITGVVPFNVCRVVRVRNLIGAAARVVGRIVRQRSPQLVSRQPLVVP